MDTGVAVGLLAIDAALLAYISFLRQSYITAKKGADENRKASLDRYLRRLRLPEIFFIVSAAAFFFFVAWEALWMDTLTGLQDPPRLLATVASAGLIVGGLLMVALHFVSRRADPSSAGDASRGGTLKDRLQLFLKTLFLPFV